MSMHPFCLGKYFLDDDLDFEEDLYALGDLDLQDPISPCDVLKRF